MTAPGTHPLILPETANPVQNAARECRREAARMREIGRDDLARVMERNAAEVAAERPAQPGRVHTATPMQSAELSRRRSPHSIAR